MFVLPGTESVFIGSFIAVVTVYIYVCQCIYIYVIGSGSLKDMMIIVNNAIAFGYQNILTSDSLTLAEIQTSI